MSTRKQSFSRDVVLAAFLLLALCVPALADSATFILNTPNGGLSGSPAPYGQVSLTLAGSNAINVSVQMFSNFAGTYGIAGGGAAFGFNGPSGMTANNFSSLTPGFSCCSSNGYGDFQYYITGPPPKRNAPTTMLFTVTAPAGFNGGNGFTSVSQLGTGFMAHVIPPNGNPTGYATTSVPDGDPSSWVLLGSGLLVIGMLGKRRTER